MSSQKQFRLRNLLLASLLGLGVFWLVTPSGKTEAIQENELYGTWSLDFSTLTRGEGLTTPKIEKTVKQSVELRGDGTCTYDSYSAFQPGGKYLSSEGTWSLKKDMHTIIGETWRVSLELRPSATELVGLSFYVKRKDGRLILYDSFGDPDLGQFVEFERR